LSKLYNKYAGVELRLDGHKDSAEYKIGDHVGIDDGIYLGVEGAIVVMQGLLVAKFSGLNHKYGSYLSSRSILETFWI